MTGNVQPYWFEEQRSHSGYYGTARRRRRENTTKLADRVEDFRLDGPSTEKDRRADRKKMQREKERQAYVETMWPTVRDEYFTIFGLRKLSPEQEVRMRNDTRILLEKEWDILEEERRAKKRERKGEGKAIVRLPIRNISNFFSNSPLPSKMKDGSGAGKRGDKAKGISRRLREVLHLPARPTSQDAVVAPPFHPILQGQLMTSLDTTRRRVPP